MIKTRKCEECNNIHQIGYICNFCNKEIDLGLPILIQFGYGNELDGIEAHFCSNQCAIKYLEEKWKI